MGSTSGWSIDTVNQLASHENGLKVRLSRGEVIDIVELPKGLPTRELPGLLEAAAAAYKAGEKGTASQPSPPPATGPRKSKLSLSKRK